MAKWEILCTALGLKSSVKEVTDIMKLPNHFDN